MKDRKLRKYLGLEDFCGNLYGTGTNTVLRESDLEQFRKLCNLNFGQVSGMVSGLQKIIDRNKNSADQKFANVALNIVEKIERLEKYFGIELVHEETPVYKKVKKSKKTK